MMSGNYGLDSKLWLELQTLIQMNHSYRELPGIHDGSPLDYEKVVKDVLYKWKFLTLWVNYLGDASVDALKHKPSYNLVLQEIVADEPFCFEAVYHSSVTNYCHACAFYWMTGKSCQEIDSFKELVCRPFFSGKGVFRPFGVVKVILKIKNGSPIREVEALRNVWKRSYAG